MELFQQPALDLLLPEASILIGKMAQVAGSEEVVLIGTPGLTGVKKKVSRIFGKLTLSVIAKSTWIHFSPPCLK